MSLGMVTCGNQVSFRNYCSAPYHSNPKFFSGLSFNIYLSKPSFPLRTNNSKSIATNPIKATINSFSVSTRGSFYDLLGIPENGTLSEIKRAYKQLARKYHPDVSPAEHKEEYTRRFIEVQEAYETLSDPRSRALYDKDMAIHLHLSFPASARNKHSHNMEEERIEWQNRWQSQLAGLKRRSRNMEETRKKASWGARMRRHNGIYN